MLAMMASSIIHIRPRMSKVYPVANKIYLKHLLIYKYVLLDKRHCKTLFLFFFFDFVVKYRKFFQMEGKDLNEYIQRCCYNSECINEKTVL